MVHHRNPDCSPITPARRPCRRSPTASWRSRAYDGRPCVGRRRCTWNPAGRDRGRRVVSSCYHGCGSVRCDITTSRTLLVEQNGY